MLYHHRRDVGLRFTCTLWVCIKDPQGDTLGSTVPNLPLLLPLHYKHIYSKHDPSIPLPGRANVFTKAYLQLGKEKDRPTYAFHNRPHPAEDKAAAKWIIECCQSVTKQKSSKYRQELQVLSFTPCPVASLRLKASRIQQRICCAATGTEAPEPRFSAACTPATHTPVAACVLDLRTMILVADHHRLPSPQCRPISGTATL